MANRGTEMNSHFKLKHKNIDANFMYSTAVLWMTMFGRHTNSSI